MKNLIIILAIACLGLATFGCSMCCGPHDFDYPTYGGKFQRTDPAYGRVGSPFSDPATVVDGPSADSNLSAGDTGRMREPPTGDLDDPTELDMLQDEEFEKENELRPQNDPLPVPKTSPEPETDESTAFRRWRQKPLRRSEQWR